MRSGTENVPAIAAMALAFQMGHDDMDADREHVLSDRMLTMPTFGRHAYVAERMPDRSYDMSCPLPDYLAEVEMRILREAIINAGGNISKAADALQIKRQTLQHKLKKYHISVL